MKTATVAEFREQFPKVFEWIEAGEEIEVMQRESVVARIVPAQPSVKAGFKVPAFAERAEAILGKSFPLQCR